MASKALEAGRAAIKASLTTEQVRKGLRNLSKQLATMGAKFNAIGRQASIAGGAITAAFTAAVKTFTTVGDDLDKLSHRTGISVESLAGLGFASEQAGQSVQVLEASIARMQRSIFDAGRGLSTPTEALDKMNMSVAQLEGLSPEEQFRRLADGIASIEDPTTQAGVAMSIFGQAGRKMIPLLKDGSAGLDRFQAEAERLGLVMSKEDTEAAAEMADAFNRLWKQTRMVFAGIGSAVANELLALLRRSENLIASVIQWTKSNKTFLTTVAKIGVLLTAAGAAFVGIGTALSLGSLAAAGFLKAITLTVAIIGALLSPVGLLTAGLAGLLVWAMRNTGAFGRLGEKFKGIWKIFGETITAIGQALAAGDLKAASDVLWAGLKLAWLDGTMELRAGWLSMTNKMLNVMHRFSTKIRDAFGDAVTWIIKTWAKAIESIASAGASHAGIANLLGQDQQTLSNVARAMGFAGAAAEAVNQSNRADRAKELALEIADNSKEEKQAREALNDELRDARSQFAERSRRALVAFEESEAARNAQGEANGTGHIVEQTIGRASKATSLFDTSRAGQIFGFLGQSLEKEQLEVLTEIARHTKALGDNGLGLEIGP